MSIEERARLLLLFVMAKLNVEMMCDKSEAESEHGILNALRTAQEATRQEAYAALCARCANGDVPMLCPVLMTSFSEYRHFGTVLCFADALRKRWSE